MNHETPLLVYLPCGRVYRAEKENVPPSGRLLYHAQSGLDGARHRTPKQLAEKMELDRGSGPSWDQEASWDQELAEWLEAMDDVLKERGADGARDLMGKLQSHLSHRGLVLTDTGQVVNQYADEIFNLGAELTQRVKSRQALQPTTLNVGIVNDISR